jgi:hypothetical protein
VAPLSLKRLPQNSKKMTFGRRRFLTAVNWYHENPPYQEEPVYRALVINASRHQRLQSAVDAVCFLDVWGGYRFRRRGLSKARRYLPGFLRQNAASLARLDRARLENFDESDFEIIRDLMAQLENGLCFTVNGREIGAPTAAGKLLHYLLPHGVMMWDGEVVRTNAYNIGDGAVDFVSYQRFGKRLLLHLAGKDGRRALRELATMHSSRCKLSYYEPLPKLLDEMAYRPSAAKAAARIVGHPIFDSSQLG